jgi:ABC-type sugar transport system ATPase subunit
MGFLDIRRATKSYGAVKILHETDISVEEGEFLVLVGPSGCGKSTLLNMIAGLEEVTSGDIAIKGRSMNGVRPAERNIAMVFQSYALYPNMNVGQNIAFGLEMHGVPKPERDKAVAQVAELLQIKHLLDRKPGQLSGGQRQRVAMGRALVRDPDVFLFDEPLSNLDAKLRVDMRTEIKKLHQKLKTTIVYVTHDQIEALTLSTRIAVMFGGHVQQLGTPKEIYDSPANMFVAGFMGSPSMNLFAAKILVEKGQGRGEGHEGGRRDQAALRRGPRLRAPCGTRHHPRPAARGDHRPRRRRSPQPGGACRRGAGRGHRAGGIGYLRRLAPRRQGGDRPFPGGRGRAAGAGLPLRHQHGEGRRLRPQDRNADRVRSGHP